MNNLCFNSITQWLFSDVQHLDGQLEELKAAGRDRIFGETICGAPSERRELTRLAASKADANQPSPLNGKCSICSTMLPRSWRRNG
jgi:hypothetical protein